MVHTGFESNFADHEPARVEVELCLDEASDAVRDGNDDIASELDERVSHQVQDDGRLFVVDHSTDAEPQHGLSKHAHVLSEHVVGMEPNRREVPNALEFEEDFDKPSLATRPVGTVVPPADPLVALVSPVVWIQTEVAVTFDAVCELAKTSAELVISGMTIVGEVVQVNLGASTLALRHVVRQHAICMSSTFSSVTPTQTS